MTHDVNILRSCVDMYVQESEAALVVAEQEYANGGLRGETRQRIMIVRDDLNEALGEFMGENQDDEGDALEETLLSYFHRFKVVLGEQPTKPKPQGRPFPQRKKQRIGEV